MKEKIKFISDVTVIIDTREKNNVHIIKELEKYGVKYKYRKLDVGDYSFIVKDKDFTHSFCIERKANIEELYSNIMHDRPRIEKEFIAARNNLNQFVLLIENCKDLEFLKEYEVPDEYYYGQNRKVKNIGEHCYTTIMSWQCGNRYNFRTLTIEGQKYVANHMLENFYYYWRNYKQQVAPVRKKKKE